MSAMTRIQELRAQSLECSERAARILTHNPDSSEGYEWYRKAMEAHGHMVRA